MKRALMFLFPLFSGLLVPAVLHAQTITAPIDPFGQIFSADIRPEVQEVNAAKSATSAAYTILGLGFHDSSASKSGSFSFGYGNSIGGRDLLLLGSYSRIQADKGGDADRASAYGELTLTSKTPVALSLVAAAVYDPNSFKTYSVVLAAERALVPDSFKITANLGWAALKPKTGNSTSDIQPAVGISYSPKSNPLWTFSADYTLKNDVDGEDSGSFAISYKIKSINSNLKLTGQKHNTYGLSLARVF